MLSEDKPGDKPRQRSRKGGQRGQKAGRQGSAPLDQREGDQADQAGSMVAPMDAPREATSISETGPDVPAVEVPAVEEVAAADASPTEATAPVGEGGPVNLQTIANAYRDYTRKSFQVNRSFVEQLMGVRSLDKAVAVQTDYATQTYANFVAESQKICGLYSELARQTLKPWKASSPR
jgi:hypothetical protein